MKPCEDGEGVAMNKTSKDLTYPNMTQDEPERVKERGKGTHPLYDEIEVLQKLYGDKSEQYVAERLAHEWTKNLLSVSEKRAEEVERKLFAKDRYDPDDHRDHYDMAYAGHGRGLVVDQVDGKFTERTMTPGELMAREPAMKIAQQIHKLACYAAFAYIKCWEIFAPVLSDVTADRDRFKSERDSSQASLLRVVEALKPFADIADAYAAAHERHVRNYADQGFPGAPPLSDGHRVSVALGDLRKARTALSPHTEKGAGG